MRQYSCSFGCDERLIGNITSASMRHLRMILWAVSMDYDIGVQIGGISRP